MTKPFFPGKPSNSFYKHFCIGKWRKKNLIKKREFSWTRQQDNIEGYLRWKKLRNRQAGSRDMAPFVIRACPGSTWATPGADRRRDKNENFFWSTPNDPIRKVNRLKSIFEHLSTISPTTGCSHPSLRKFSRKIWKHDHQKPGRYTVILWWTVDISDVFVIIEGGQLSVEGFAFVTSVLLCF